jgi:carbon storage regulator
MLIISRNITESFYIGDGIKVTILARQGNQIRIGIDAPLDLTILREELVGIPDDKKDKELNGNK